jgi:H+/Cl- antiporter ClcA
MHIDWSEIFMNFSSERAWLSAQVIGKWVLLGTLVGILSGSASALFLITLDWMTNTRIANGWLLFLLPLAGLAVGFAYHHYAGRAKGGNALVIDEVHINQERIPARMTPFVLIGTLVTHLFGGSAGREGTAIQMGASLADTARRILRLNAGDDRRLMLLAGISGGFSSVFGTPIAGFIFGMEVDTVGRVRYEGIIPCLVSALVGDWVTRAWGAGHSHYPLAPLIESAPAIVIKVAIAGVIFGITSRLFVLGIKTVKTTLSRFIAYPPFRLVVGGILIIGMTLLIGNNDYLGLSLPLIQNSVRGEGVVMGAFLLKLIFTVVTLGSGFLGGEVTPLFVIGSTLGYTLGVVLGIDPAWLAMVGFVAVFAASSNTPIACIFMAIELFGGNIALMAVVGCMVAYLVSGHEGIYHTQRIETRKAGR